MTTSTRTGRRPVSRPCDRPDAPGQQETIEALLAETKRGIVPIRKTFLQAGFGPTTAAGPMSGFIRGGDVRGLEAYLVAHAMASSSGPYTVSLDAGTWVRILGIGVTADNRIDPDVPSALSAVSKAFRRIEDRKLIVRSRVGRRSSITLLRENGSGTGYYRPRGKSRSEQWFRLPHAYWTQQHYRTLSLPAKAVLLIALSLPDGFRLPERSGPDWYGVSPETIGEGIRELVGKGLLNREFNWVKAPRAAHGHTRVHRYTLVGPYSQAERDAAAYSRGTEHDLKLDVDDAVNAALHLVVTDHAEAQSS